MTSPRQPADLARAQRSGVDRFEAHYAGRPGAGWEISRPQPRFAELAGQGEFRGRVLDVGCGTGDNALLTAAMGLDTTGVDAAPTGIAIAASKASERGLAARFLVYDVLDLAMLGECFDTVLDCGLFHCFTDEDRPALVESLRAVTPEGGRYFMMCFSDREPGTWGPRRVRRAEIEDSFAVGWQIDRLERTTMAVAFEPGTAAAWFAAMTRTAS
ncbi:MAG TPA: class I SAM-dependent methyltransferase [Streptosporangiaceae bacterium]